MERVLELDPANTEAWCHRAIVHLRHADHAAAARCYRHALTLDTACVAARTGLISGLIPAVPMSEAQALDARVEFERELGAFERWLEARELAANDAWAVARQDFFYLSYQERSNRTLLQRYRGTSSARLKRLTGFSRPSRRARAPGSRLRLGIVSAHIYDHSVFNAIVRGWLERIDRNRFETTVFHLGIRRDAATARAERAVDRFEGQPRTLAEWAALIHKRDLDALIFPEVGIDRNSLALAGLNLGRRQFVAWGHPETSGLPTIDAFISAEAFEPQGAEEHYSEQLVRLPNLGVYYQPEPVEPATLDLDALGIRTDGPVFVCSGAPFKYRPEDDGVLVEIARRVPLCTFVFFTYERRELSAILRARLSAALAAAGLSAERLLAWIPWQPRREFLGLLEQADVYLDTIGFSGFNTIMQAIEAHLPCVALEGRFMRGRLGSGVLRRLELDELIALNKTEYVEIAARLATDRAYRIQIADRLRRAESRAYADQSAVAALERTLLA
jgi:predicted O-linked N-acetylglucosamine transferase (SPINDLY family)